MAKPKKVNKAAHPGDTFVMPPDPHPRREASIQKADNGFIVRSYQNGKERLKIAKTKQEADKYAAEMLKI